MTTDTSKNIDTIIEDDDDELDLVKLVATNANDSNQYLVFVGSNGELYAMNVSNIEELLIFKEFLVFLNFFFIRWFFSSTFIIVSDIHSIIAFTKIKTHNNAFSFITIT